MVRAAAGNLPEQNQNNKCVNRPPGTAVKKYAGTYDLPCTLKQADYSKYQKKVRFYLKLDLLILDDFLLHTITDEREIKVLFEVMEKRSELSRCTIVCSQREPNSWASMILNDEVSANAILKRATKHYTVVIQPRN